MEFPRGARFTPPKRPCGAPTDRRATRKGDNGPPRLKSRLLGSEGWTFDVAGGSTGDAVNGASNLSEDLRARQSCLFDALDRLEERLARSRYLAGGRLTEV